MAKRGKLSRNRRGRDFIERPVRWRKYKQICLIVCEDESTEPLYFNSFAKHFPDEVFFLRCVGTGRDALGVVEAAVRESKDLAEEAQKEVDFIWAVFDKDDLDLNEKRIRRFREAYRVAKENNINVALSNEAFELWLLLHFVDLDGSKPVPRADLYAELGRQIASSAADDGFIYKHGDVEIVNQVLLHGDEALAIERAEALDQHFANVDPIYCNPSTKVYQLVKELRAFIRFHNWVPE